MLFLRREDMLDMTEEEYVETLTSLRKKGLIEIREVDGELKHVLTPMGEMVFQTLTSDPKMAN